MLANGHPFPVVIIDASHAAFGADKFRLRYPRIPKCTDLPLGQAEIGNFSMPGVGMVRRAGFVWMKDQLH
jgi:hypothetical protein